MVRFEEYMPMIEEYLDGNAILTFISEDISELHEIISYLAERPDGFIDVLAPDIIHPDAEVVLTTTSIVMLYRYDLLDDLNEYFKPIILRDSIKNIQDNIRNLENKIISEKRKLNRSLNYEGDELYIEDLKMRLEVLFKIYNSVNKYKIIDIYPKANDNIVSLVVPKSDMEAANFAKMNDMYLIVDDAGSINLFETFVENTKITNTSAILNTLLCMYGNFDQYIERFYKLIEDNYLYALDFRYLCSIIGICIQENRREDMKEVVEKLLVYDKDGRYKILLQAYLDLSPNCRLVEREIIEEILEKYI